METLGKYLVVAAGSALGGMLRYYLGTTGMARLGAPFPTATFIINITGSFILGLFLTLVVERVIVNPHWRLAVAVGFVSSYTTFSTFEYETLWLIEEKRFALAALYVVASVTVGFISVCAGVIVGRLVRF